MSDPSGRILPTPFGGPALVRDHLASAGRAREFLRRDPQDDDHFVGKLEEVRGRFPSPRLEATTQYLRPTSAEAAAKLQQVVAERGVVVTTGQQAGLLGGPLLTLFKAISAARLARRLEHTLRIPVLPVFWIASEDHDWAEVNHVHLPVPRAGIRRLELRGGAHDGRPMSQTRLSSDINRILDETAQLFSTLPFGDDYITQLQGAYREGRTVAEAFGDLLHGALAPLGVCLVDAADPALKRASVGVLQGAVQGHAGQERALADRAEQLLAAGYHVQVPVLAGMANVAYHGAGGRERLVREGGRWVAPLAREAWSDADLVEAMGREPGRFSPNALLRPVVESHVLPTVAYVGGPAELSYLAESDVLFSAHGIEPPVAVARWSGMILEPFADRLLDRLDLEVGDLVGAEHEVVERVARRRAPARVTDALAGARRAIESEYGLLREVAGEIDPTLTAAMELRRGRSLIELAKAERKIIRAIKRRESERLAQLERLRANLRPFGAPQERVIGWIHYLAACGPGLLDRVGEGIWSDRAGADPARAEALCS